MKLSEFIASTRKNARTLVDKYAPPKGWSTVDEIRVALNIAHTRNASSRAHDMWRRGMLKRQAWQFRAATGQCHMAYIYKPMPEYRSIAEASGCFCKHAADKVPSGWVRIVDYSFDKKISDVAIRNRVLRAGLKPRYFKTPRGVSGLHMNAYYKKSALDRICA